MMLAQTIKERGTLPTRPETFLAIAEVISLRAQCQRRQVGAVITVNDRIVSTGYNGPLKGMNCNDENCGAHLQNKCSHAVHAEANAIANAAKLGILLQDATLYCTASPCYECAKIIIQAGIVRVYYNIPYRLTEGIELLTRMRIPVEQITI